jgi:hypothetical protein
MAQGRDNTRSASADIGAKITTGAPAIAGANVGTNAGSDGTPVALPLTFIPPASAQFFTLQDEVDSAAIENVVFGATFRVPDNHIAVVKTLEFFATLADATIANFSFSLLAGGNAVPGFEGVTVPQVGGTQGVKFDPAFIRIEGSKLVSVRRINTNGNPHHVGFFLHGYYWPIDGGV